MKNHSDHNEDQWLKNLISASGIEKAPDSFTANIMSRLEKVSSPVVYKPVISKLGWLIIMGMFLIIVIASSTDQSSTGYFNQWIDTIPQMSFQLPALFTSPQVSLSSTSLTIILLLIVLACWLIQREIKKIFIN